MAFRCLFFMLLMLSKPALADDASLKDCQSWQKQVDKYQDLRRRGGSSFQMDSWKKQRRAYEDKIKDSDCKQYGRKVMQYSD